MPVVRKIQQRWWPAAVATAAALLLVATFATSASAQVVHPWRSVPTNPGACIVKNPTATSFGKSCILVNANDDAQGWVVVGNNGSATWRGVSANIDLYDRNLRLLSSVHCPATDLAPGRTMACPGETKHVGCGGAAHVYSTLAWSGGTYVFPRASKDVVC